MQVQESAAGNDVWIDLEDGVQIRFTTGGEYRTGDYWLIPARVATGNIEWPQDHKLNPQPLPPHGVEHHYALIGWVERTGGKTNVLDLRCEFRPCSTASLARKSDSLNKDLRVRRAASHG
jgi:hypothetical protein